MTSSKTWADWHVITDETEKFGFHYCCIPHRFRCNQDEWHSFCAHCFHYLTPSLWSPRSCHCLCSLVTLAATGRSTDQWRHALRLALLADSQSSSSTRLRRYRLVGDAVRSLPVNKQSITFNQRVIDDPRNGAGETSSQRRTATSTTSSAFRQRREKIKATILETVLPSLRQATSVYSDDDYEINAVYCWSCEVDIITSTYK